MAETRVLYNGDCPVCSAEIGHYRRYSDRNKLSIRFDDLNAPELADWGLDADTAAKRLYVARGGQLHSGIPAFLILWSEMPRYQWLARIVGLPIIRQLAEICYEQVLAPLIYKRHLRRKRRAPN